jgi:branched-chain amino acid aminotransferase
MVNFNGMLYGDDAHFISHRNRGLRYGDALFEIARVLGGKIVFWEDHYLRLMSSMRLMRMEIPMNFTMEYLEAQIGATLEANALQNSAASVRLTIFRKGEGNFLPESREISWYMEVEQLDSPYYVLDEKTFKIELFKDFYISDDLLATLNTNNKALRVAGSIYSSENGYDSCLLLNHRKMVVEALNGNLFLVNGKNLKTPPLSDGCTNGIIRKKVLEIVNKVEGYSIEEGSVSPFDLQKADELFLAGSVIGIRPVTHYRKATYETKVAREILGKINAMARLN